MNTSPATLYRSRPRNAFLRYTLLAFALATIIPWLSIFFGEKPLFSAERKANLGRFLRELAPYPLQGKPFDAQVYYSWASELLQKKGYHAVTVTLAISVFAIVLASAIGLILSAYANRNLLREEPYEASKRRGRVWILSSAIVRLFAMFLRAIPEYVWAFIFLTMIGPTAWPAVLALAAHNAGVLGRLHAETMENLNPNPLRALRGLGASRTQLAVAALLPLSLPRFLVFFFSRWEMCVRESTVLGLLGIVSLGYWIQDARARNFYDEMFFFVLLGAVLVLLGDLVSASVRALMRKL